MYLLQSANRKMMMLGDTWAVKIVLHNGWFVCISKLFWFLCQRIVVLHFSALLTSYMV
jgi:hypothetical protein